MRLAEFIRQNKKSILEEWERFASELSTAPDEMSDTSLRDHAESMLDFVADALKYRSSREEVKEKLRGLSSRGNHQSAAEEHGGDRMEWGFSVRDMTAEFRALRSSVVRLWGEKTQRMGADDLIRFNEALDQALAESMERFMSKKERQNWLLDAMLSYSTDHSCIFSRDGTILYANDAMARTYGKYPHDLVGEQVESLDAAFAAEVRRQIRHVVSTGQEYRGDFTINAERGEAHVIDYLFAPIKRDDGEIEAIAANARDITEQRQLERTLWMHANHDHLTGAPNRRLLLDRLDQDIRIAKRTGGLLALLYIDLDKFKDANDRLGHEGGDELLRQVAERIRGCTRETDTVARMGGDEFAVVLVEVGDKLHVEAVASAILAQLSQPFHVDGSMARIGGSIGISLYPEHGDDMSELIAHADDAMYMAKSLGGDTFRFQASLGEPGEGFAPGRASGDQRRH